MIEIDQILRLCSELRLHLFGDPRCPIAHTMELCAVSAPASRAQTASRSPASSTLPMVAPKIRVTEPASCARASGLPSSSPGESFSDPATSPSFFSATSTTGRMLPSISTIDTGAPDGQAVAFLLLLRQHRRLLFLCSSTDGARGNHDPLMFLELGRGPAKASSAPNRSSLAADLPNTPGTLLPRFRRRIESADHADWR